MEGDSDREEDHIKRHKELHVALDELVADFINHTGKLPSKITLMELMEWSADQIKNPTEEAISDE